MQEQEPGLGLRIFVSYSRKDAQFTGLLADRLRELNYIVDFDQSTQVITTGISPSDHWWVRVQDLIAAADVVVLVVSPDSSSSPVVDEELAYASLLAKRIIAITCRDTNFETAPPRLAALNVNHWFLNLDFTGAIEELAHALDRDVDWLRMAARLTSDAKVWRDEKNSVDRLLVGQEIAMAELWSARRPATVPEPSDLALGYIAASRQAQQEQLERRTKQLRRTMRLQWAASIAIGCVIVATVLSGYFVLDGTRELSRARSTVIARAAKQSYVAHDYVRALRLSVLASHDSVNAPAAAEANDLIVASAQASRLMAAFAGHRGVVSAIKFTEGLATFLSWSKEDQTVRIWQVSSGAELKVLELPSLSLGHVDLVRFSPAGDHIIVSGDDGWQMLEVKGANFKSVHTGDTSADLRWDRPLDGVQSAFRRAPAQRGQTVR
nr:TIR domain-containing protein [Rhizobium grahamii]